MAQLKTHKPSGQAPWPLILLTGETGSGRSWRSAQFTGSDKIGRAFWIDLGESCGEEYGEVPGADYEVVEHDGTWVDIIGQVEAVKEVAVEHAKVGKPPVLFVLDSMTHEWSMLSAWTDKRARRQRGNQRKLAEDPDAEIDVTMNLWNDTNSRHNQLMNILKTFPGIVIMIADEKEISQLDKGGNPIAGKKEWKPEGQKFLGRDSSVWIRLFREEAPQVVKCRSVHYGIRPGVDKPKKVPDFTFDWLVFDLLKCNSKTRARSVSALDADQVMPDELPPLEQEPEDHVATNGDKPPVTSDWTQRIKQAEDNKDLPLLRKWRQEVRGDTSKPPSDPELFAQITAAGLRVKDVLRQEQMNHLFALLAEGGISSSDEDKPRRLKAAQGLLARDSLTTYADLTDAEIAEFIETLTGLKKVGTLAQRLIDFGGPPVTALKVVVEELLNAHNVEAAISLMEQVTARPDVEAEVADLLPESDKETLGIREGQSVHLLDLAEKVSRYTEKHKVGPRVVESAAA